MAKQTTMGARKMVSLPRDLAAKVEDFRYEHRFSTEASAIRELIRLGLEAFKQQQRSKSEPEMASPPPQDPS